ncbi:hypothetical protein [Pseudomonas sp. T1.Ur]|uniref:hypothetical protein n=1 Tax=Pseudomonas sp. T1.Ur TaxID=2928704 RepID=UPI00201E5419|nr:hypothetical protein [Pseudomonas sp. T1.Ur]MCL6702027.1 hypothetical protein [Pseudomonas sp. T1.Ur]
MRAMNDFETDREIASVVDVLRFDQNATFLHAAYLITEPSRPGNGPFAVIRAAWKP